MIGETYILNINAGYNHRHKKYIYGGRITEKNGKLVYSFTGKDDDWRYSYEQTLSGEIFSIIAALYIARRSGKCEKLQLVGTPFYIMNFFKDPKSLSRTGIPIWEHLYHIVYRKKVCKDVEVDDVCDSVIFYF